jgi:DNA-binding response OmpR family regulator/uncharacterized coiled-coil protein SlyX/uncharacterized protein YoxC
MPKKILIVENDRGLSREMKAELEGRGFQVDETADGKKSIDLIRRSRPDLVILSVELAAGQSGYIICGKLKKDDDLSTIPVVIVGSPDGFVQHSKLKTRADEYVPKPVDLQLLVEKVGDLVGMPEAAGGAEDSLALEDVVETDEELPVEEISLDDATFEGDPELDMLDQAFDASTSQSSEGEGAQETGESESPPSLANGAGPSDADAALDALESDSLAESAPYEAPAEKHSEAVRPGQADMEIRSLRAQLSALQRSLAEAQSRQNDAEERARELEAQLQSTGAELAAVASTGAKGDKEFFALREALNRKGKEVLQLSSGLKDKETEMVELRDHEVKLEQQLSESSVELARREAQIKAVNTRTEQLAGERKKLQEDLNETRNRLQARESETEELRSHVNQVDETLRQAQSESGGLRNQFEALQSAMNAAHREAQHTQTRLSSEADSLRARVAELEQTAAKQEDRMAKLFQKVRAHEKVREKTKKALSIALQLLEEQGSPGEDEPASA